MIDYEGLNKHRLETKNEILKMINENDRVAVVRPTGYGKSHLITELCNELPGKKLILEPGKEVINYMEKFGIETIDTDYDTYYSLLKPEMVELIIKFEQYDYIFLDEMHRVLAEKWGNKLFNIFKALNMLNNKVKILGFSATPVRGDNKNVVEEVFHGIQIEPYYLADAILDNFLPMPNYHCGIYEIEDKDKRKMTLKNEQLAKQILEYDIDASLSKMFKENLDFNKEHRIICFTDKVNNIKKAYDNIVKWFGININVFEVNHNQSKSKTQSIIDKFISTKGINVLFCVNILNEGVHLPGVDCVIFLRKTKSNVIYNQQLGRVINTEIEEPIIFDLVNNAINPEWGYNTIFKDKAKKQNKKVEELKTKNGEKLKITLEQIDLFNLLNHFSKFKCDKITKEIIQYIIKNGPNSTAKEMADHFNLKIPTVIKICNRYNVNYLRRINYFTEEEEKILLDLINDGKKSEEIAVIMGRTRGVILGHAYRKGYKWKSRNKRTSNEKINLIKELAPYKTIKELEEITGIKGPTLRSIISKNKINYKKQNLGSGKKRARLTKEEKEYIIKNAPNKTCRQMADELGKPIATIGNFCKRHNIKFIRERFSNF